MVSLLLTFSALIALSTTLIIPTSPNVQQAQSNNSSPPLPPLKTLAIANILPLPLPLSHFSNANTTTTPPYFTAWPPLPFTTDTGHHLNLTITQLGPPLPPTRREILNDITELHRVIATEGNPYEKIAGVYARSSGVVWTVFRCKAGVDMKRYQAVQVVTAVWFFMLDFGPREVLGSEITVEGTGLARFVLRVFDSGRGVVG